MVKEFTKDKKRQRENLLSNIEVEGSSWGRDHGTEREWEVLQQLRGSYVCELCKQVDRQVSRCRAFYSGGGQALGVPVRHWDPASNDRDCIVISGNNALTFGLSCLHFLPDR